MSPTTSVAAHPSGDKRFKLLEAAMKRHLYQPDALIEVLHAAQGLFGWLELDLLFFIARSLKLPPSKVFGVATFYHLFSLQPKGQHTCVVCLGTACYVKGADRLLAAAEEELATTAGATTPDGKVTLTTARCIGASGLAPAVVMDGTVRGHVSAEALRRELKGWLANGTGRPV
jgi:bidirectional [NiFe] hydrogenase diaphorase subunit